MDEQELTNGEILLNSVDSELFYSLYDAQGRHKDAKLHYNVLTFEDMQNAEAL